MDKRFLIFMSALFVIPFLQSANAQVINVTSTTPCFLNETAGPWVWRDCGMDDDYLTTIVMPFEWITGGNFSMILASIFVMFTYIKYHKAIYPILIGVFMLPISYFVFPETFIIWGTIMAFVAVGLIAAFIILKQTKEY